MPKDREWHMNKLIAQRDKLRAADALRSKKGRWRDLSMFIAFGRLPLNVEALNAVWEREGF